MRQYVLRVPLDEQSGLMAYLSNSNHAPEPTSAKEIPALKARGNLGGAVAITVIGWLVFSPAFLVFAGFSLMAALMSSGNGDSNNSNFYVQSFFVGASAVASPLLLGMALYRRSTGLLIFGALATIPAILGLIHVATG